MFLQGDLLKVFQTRTFKYIGVLPIEAPPLCASWAMVLMQMDKAFIISDFGAKEAQRMGVDAEHLQIGIDTETWKAPDSDERQRLRTAFGLEDDEFVILTVADNQERKNLSRAMEIVADFIHVKRFPLERKMKARYILVTREHFWGGWKIRDYAQELDIDEHLIVIERGIPFQELWSLYAMADVFLLTSKAEGLGMPILESMAMNVPVVCTNATAMQELIGDGERGYPIGYWDFPNFDPYTDPFGNGLRYFAKRRNGHYALKRVSHEDSSKRVQAAYKYISERTHQISVDQMQSALEKLDV
jgi:glycosyltransferase involved in cell wall biosynthesis